MTITSLSMDAILAIPISNPEKLFTKVGIKKELKQLYKKWHPDTNPTIDTNKVCAHFQALSKEAQKKINNNTWNGPAELEFIADGKTFRLSYKKMHNFELGKMYISSTKICYVLDLEFEDLFRNGIKMIQSIKYPNKKFEDEFKKFIPNIVKIATNTNIGHVLVLEKTVDVVMLQDLLDYLPEQKMLPRHVMWVMSSLSNLLCFLEFNKIAHLGISPQTVFVSPEFHSCMIYGGWWYSRPHEEKMIAIPVQLATILPSSVFVDKLAKTQYDRFLVKSVGLAALSDKTLTGSTLLKNNVVPKPILDWLRSTPSKTSVIEYSNWDRALTEGFGRREFIKLDINPTDIY
jgi:hypothetical protein